MSCWYKSLSFFDIFVYFWSEAAMVDNKRKALLSGNDFQSFLISSQSCWDKATIFQLFWQRECCIKFPFFVCKIWFSDWNLHFLELEYKGHMLLFVPREMAEEMLRFKALPNLIWGKNIYLWSCTVSYGTEPDPRLGCSLWHWLQLLSALTKQKVRVHRGGTAVLYQTRGLWSPAAYLQLWLIVHAQERASFEGKCILIWLPNTPQPPTIYTLGTSWDKPSIFAEFFFFFQTFLLQFFETL